MVTGRSSVSPAVDPLPLSPCAAPHDGQNRAPGGTAARHSTHSRGASAIDPLSAAGGRLSRLAVPAGPAYAPDVSRTAKPTRRRRVIRWVERAALGAVMGAIAFVLERRLLRARRRRGRHGADEGADLSVAGSEAPS
jgi:hypothetical protein